jgi:hypothetical protein
LKDEEMEIPEDEQKKEIRFETFNDIQDVWVADQYRGMNYGEKSRWSAKDDYHPPPYEGTSDVMSWVRKFEKAADFNGWNDNMKIRKVRKLLKGNAALFADSLADINQMSWSSFKMALERAFTTPDRAIDIHRNLEDQALKEGKVDDFIWKVLTLCDDLDPDMPNHGKLMYLRRGFPASLQTHFTMIPQTVEEFINQARYAERLDGQIMKEMRERLNKMMDSSPTNVMAIHQAPQKDPEIDVIKRELRDLSKKMGELMDRIPVQEKKKSKKDIQCYNCEKMGHYSSECRAPRKSRRQERADADQQGRENENQEN